MTVSDPPHQSAHSMTNTRLRGNMSAFKLLFTVLAFNGPIIAVVAFLPVVIGYGNGLGAPVMYLTAGVIIALFAVGFIKMSRHVDNPGGFYSFVTKGLGREVGLGAALVAILGYAVLYVGSYPLEGTFFQAFLRDTLGGPDIAWWVWTLAMFAVVSVLGYFNLEFSARTLTVCMALEAVMIIAYNAAVIGRGGSSGLSLSSFVPANIFSGDVGIGLLFAMLCFTGFESTVIFRDEIRQPDKTIPRASFGFIGVIATGYALSCWAIIQAVGAVNVVSATAEDPSGTVMASIGQFAGKTALDIVTVLLCTSGFASALALHNVLSRYLFNLGVDGIVSPRLGRSHPKHGSPHLASLALSAVVLLAIVVMIINNADPLLVYAPFSGAFGYAFVLLLMLTTVAVLVFMRTAAPMDTTVWHRIIAPAAALVGLGSTLWFATQHIDLLVTGGPWAITLMFVSIVGALILGVVWALILKRTRPHSYARIGRQ
jgi:amino acid transporter